MLFRSKAFQAVNAVSSVCWVIGVLAPGAMVGFGVEEFLHEDQTMGLVAVGAGIVATALLFVWVRRQVRGSVSI